MDVTQVGVAYAVDEPTSAGAWVAEHLGFEVLVDLGWYVSTRHPGHPALSLDLVQREHPTWPAPVAGVSGAMVALVVGDVEDEHARLVAAGAEVVAPLRTEPWGQRRFQVAGPGGLLVELVQPVEPDPAWLAEQGLAG